MSKKKRKPPAPPKFAVGELEVGNSKANRPLVADDCYWFWNWR